MAERLAHGGGLDAAARQYGIPKADWLDLSTGINPVPYPVGEIPLNAWTRLPDDGAEAGLEAAARAYYGVPERAALIASPGTQALIQWLPRIVPAGRVAVFGPTYTEHAHCWQAAGHAVEMVDLGAPAPADCSVIVAVHPNNPDGHVHDRDALIAMAGPDRLVIVDEAFADTAPDASVVPAAGRPGLLVMRSFGKFFGLAGMRLGFAVGHGDLIERLSAALGPWCVPGPALEIGARALNDKSWIAETRDRLREDAARLDALMAPLTGPALGGTDLFRLYDIHETDLHARLARQGIWSRVFADRPALLRLGLPPDEVGFRRLAAALG